MLSSYAVIVYEIYTIKIQSWTLQADVTMQYMSYTPFLDGDVDIIMHFISFVNFIFA